MSLEKEYLLEMGFTEDLVEKALKCTQNRGIEAAMEWIIAHQVDEKSDRVDGKDQTGVNVAAPEDGNGLASQEARSYVCDDCKKVLRNDEAVQIHSSRTGHVNFSESTEEVKPLTEEEKQVQMEKLQELLKTKKIQRTEQEKQEELDKEKRRRCQGKTLTSAKAKYKEDELHRSVEEALREKQDDKEYLQKLKAKITREREEKKARDRGETEDVATPVTVVEPTPPPVVVAQSSCRIQVRLPTGLSLNNTFEPSDKLWTVIEYIANQWPEPITAGAIKVFTNFPKRDFSPSDMQKSLLELDLCPSVLLIAKLKP